MKTVQTVALAVLMTTGAWGAVKTVGTMTQMTPFVEDPVRFTQSHCSIVGPPTLCGYGVSVMASPEPPTRSTRTCPPTSGPR